MGIKAIFVDFNGVLFLTTNGYSHFHDIYAKTMGIPSNVLEDYFRSDWDRKVNLGEVDSVSFWRNFLNEQGISEDHFQEHFKLFYKLHTLNVPFLDFLKSHKNEKRIGLISNYSDMLRPLLENELKIADTFDDIVISSEVKLIKPDKAIYRLALERLHVKPEEAIFVDDLSENIQAAAQLGIHAIQFQNSEQVITEIKQLID